MVQDYIEGSSEVVSISMLAMSLVILKVLNGSTPKCNSFLFNAKEHIQGENSNMLLFSNTWQKFSLGTETKNSCH
jgi:hypothetical protein